MKWSDNEKELQEQVNQAFEELGFEFPTTIEELEAFDEKFKDYPFKLHEGKITVDEILKSVNSPNQ